ncbi:hypothetical protein BB561_000203 [Smittium simulii]|uniref:Uncharacterized protein n=1 Tax=Smittium simulii TaxID=133385 RepID=A0A2T9Z020_9FUNG|nr:hypothetical protein BB561_000203 [Smittium simulii]
MTFQTYSVDPDTNNIIFVSHYLPLYAIATSATEPIQWSFRKRRDHTALYAGITALQKLEHTPKAELIIVGCIGKYLGPDNKEYSTFDLPEHSKKSLKDALWAHSKQVPVFVDLTTSFNYYEGYCKQVLWPMMHYIPWEDSKMSDPIWWQDYQKVNRFFADTIIPYCTKTTIIWANDYHLLKLPEYLKEKFADPKIGLFIHCPFPSSEIFRSLPQRSEILTGMLCSDVVGFQIFSYSRHFSSSCTRILGLESTPVSINYKDNEVQLEIIPVGINVDLLINNMTNPKVIEHENMYLKMFQSKKIIVGRDKLDEVNGIILKLEAFEKFLERYAEWRDKICLIQVTQSGTNITSKLEAKISEKVSHINSKYGSFSFSPIHYYNSYLDYDEYVALLKVADLGLITAVRDGMNTGSLEYIVCQQDKHSPLILSEFTGTAGSVCGAIQINPSDTNDVAESIYLALTMSDAEKARRHKTMLKHVSSHNSDYWASTFIKSIKKNAIAMELSHFVPTMDKSTVLQAYNCSKERILLFDYDGTLVPITNIPSQALIPKQTLDSLEKLCQDPLNQVWVISGRDVKFLSSQLGEIKGLGLSAEHGGFIRYPHDDWQSLIDQLDLSWKPLVREIFEFYTERTSGSTLEEKDAAITWHYRNADPEYGEFQCHQCMNHMESVIAGSMPVELLIGKKCLEVRPKEVNKGEIVSRILGPDYTKEWDFIFVAGDDRTDEDMFKAVKEYISSINIFNCSSNDLANMNSSFNSHSPRKTKCFSVYVGPSSKKTNAFWNVASTKEIIDLVGSLCNQSKARDI